MCCGDYGRSQRGKGVGVITSNCHMYDVLKNKDSLSLRGHTKTLLLTECALRQCAITS